MLFFGAAKFEETVSRQIFKLSEDAILVLDGDLNIIMFNPAAEQVFGYHAYDIIGQPISLLIPENLRESYQDIILRFINSNEPRRHMNESGQVFTGLRKGGEEFQTRTSICRCNDKRKPIFVITVKDMAKDRKNEEELLKLATTDSLTGVYNRREFIIQAEREARRARRYGRALSVMVMDIDGFKEYNIAHGNDAGDKALQRITGICCNTLRNVDIFGRWSGGEFIALLPETSSENALIIAERLRRMISEHDMEHRGEKARLTVSVGIAEFKKNENTLDNPVARAMTAVERAQNDGRNRVCRYSD